MEGHFKEKFAIVGLGMVTGKQPGVTRRALQIEAARRAIADAGLIKTQIDGAIDLKFSPGRANRPGWTDAYPRALNLPVKFYFTIGRGGAMASLGIISATKFLELGIANYVVMAFATTDLSSAKKAKEIKKGWVGLPANIEKEGYWGHPFGDLRSFSHHTWLAARHMHEYGTTSRQLGAISVSMRKWAQMNPQAQMYGRPITVEDHQSSPVLVHPYHLMDICQMSDGAVALILTTAERAKDCAKPPVYTMGIGFGEAMDKIWWEKSNYTRLPVETAKKQAFGQAGIELKDIDLAQLYDCFTGEVLFQIEDYGFCKKGEGGPFFEEGHTEPGGDTPLNTGGGLMSAYHYGDLTCFSEAVTQLRGEAGERQVKDADICLVSGHGGEILAPGLCSVHSTTILRR
ncbi:thiolase family protein [Thermodesulfobacteriota bacterium]